MKRNICNCILSTYEFFKNIKSTNSAINQKYQTQNLLDYSYARKLQGDDGKNQISRIFVVHLASQSIYCVSKCHVLYSFNPCLLWTKNSKLIDVGTGGGALGARAPQDFVINKEVPFLFLESAPFLLRKRCPRSVVPLQV